MDHVFHAEYVIWAVLHANGQKDRYVFTNSV